MTMLESVFTQTLFTQPWVARLGWTLLHFLWQGALIAIVLAVVRGLIGSRMSVHARYALSCVALALMTAAPVGTYFALQSAGAGVQPPAVWQLLPAEGWQRALPWLVLGWLAGVVVFSLRLIGGWRMAARLRSLRVGAVPEEWIDALEHLIRRMGATRPVQLLSSALVETPAVVGWLRPVILMPVEALTGLPPEHVLPLLAHELAHVCRNDYLANILQSVAEAVLFYHPAVWWVSDQIRNERELCCDDLAVAASGGDVLRYARALAEIEARRPAHLSTAMAANGGSAHGGSLVARIARLLGRAPAVSRTLPGPGAVISVVLLWLAGIGAATLHGSQPATPRAALQAPAITALSHPATPTPGSDPTSFGVTSGASAAKPIPSSRPAAPAKPAPSARPALTALLYDPLFGLPHGAAQVQSGSSLQASTPATAPKKTHLEGTIESSTGAVMSKTMVRLAPNGPQPPPAANASPQPAAYSQTTDDSGKFAFEDVAPGRYLMTATKTGFVTGRYGSRTPTSPPTLITVGEGDTLGKLNITLTPMGVLMGRITDSDGDPLLTQVSVLRLSYVRGQQRLVTAGGGSTDDQGKFRISNLAAGRYYIRALPPIPGATGDGSDRNGPHEGNVPTYYPNAVDAANATAVTVNAGAETQGVDIRLGHAKLFEIKARLVGTDGTPATGVLELERYDPSSRSESHLMGEMIRPGGLVDYHNLTPGVFTAEVMSLNGPAAAAGGLAGRQMITITDKNVDTVLTFGVAAPLTGVFKAEEGGLATLLATAAANTSAAQNQSLQQTPAGAASTPANAPAPRLMLTPVDGLLAGNGVMNPDGTFQTTPIGAGKYFADIASLPAGVYVKSIRYGSQDGMSAPLEIAGGAAGAFEVTLSGKAADISGTVRNGKDEIMPGVTVTVWPKAANQGSATGGVKTTSTDQNGTFQLGGLAPGEYNVGAWEEIDSGLAQYREFLDRFGGDAATVKLAESGHGSADTKLISSDKIATETSKLP